MHEFIPGQRWISDAELPMGLGTVLTVDERSVTIVFLATGETRIYARQTAPLTRVRFAVGDSIRAHEGWTLSIEQVEEHQGLLTYVGRRDHGEAARLPEGELDNFIQLSRPTDRLFTGQIDSARWFELRYQSLQHRDRLNHSPLRGLTGGRTSLIPHQMYIAHEVASRYAPRVLLADEVGLGKTIEAGLILHQQLQTERARRVLIVVPESLLHQWLVEMLRRFNLYFSIFDEPRCLGIEEDTQDNPFHSEQLVLCSIEFLREQPRRLQQALDGDWDLLVVDEAHHLQWSVTSVSQEYRCIEQLAQQTRGVLLLTATPEQLGKESHFARLRLLDPDRFPDFETFLAEEAGYAPIASAVESLLSEQPLTDAALHTLQTTLAEGDNQAWLDALQADPHNAEARQELIQHLLDRHGTGRVLFRNTRHTVKGFPGREVHTYALPLPEAYRECLSQFQQSASAEPQLLLCPELLYQATAQPLSHWTRIDPRIDWLATQLKALKPQKVLVIAASADTALDIEQVLRTRTGIHAAVFHEGLSIVERDRAAAFFADPEFGSQVLICSEIGSEGRNFQFAHHLVLFDLPLNPDLLEQRIGRLDRIGQAETIQIHVPYLEQSAQAIMAHWYHEGLDAFTHTCPAGHSVFLQVETSLLEALHQLDSGLEDLPALLGTTQQLHQQMNEALQQGRDQLLEYNSCRPQQAQQLCAQAAAEDEVNQDSLSAYLEQVFDCFGVETEMHSAVSDIIRPGDHMQEPFPALNEDGMTVTYQR
ncbi:MAG: RNA polymerase-associated protein RapA, partial [Gammaproteobacteria bacterium]